MIKLNLLRVIRWVVIPATALVGYPLLTAYLNFEPVVSLITGFFVGIIGMALWQIMGGLIEDARYDAIHAATTAELKKQHDEWLAIYQPREAARVERAARLKSEWDAKMRQYREQ